MERRILRVAGDITAIASVQRIHGVEKNQVYRGCHEKRHQDCLFVVNGCTYLAYRMLTFRKLDVPAPAIDCFPSHESSTNAFAVMCSPALLHRQHEHTGDGDRGEQAVRVSVNQFCCLFQTSA